MMRIPQSVKLKRIIRSPLFFYWHILMIVFRYHHGHESLCKHGAGNGIIISYSEAFLVSSPSAILTTTISSSSNRIKTIPINKNTRGRSSGRKRTNLFLSIRSDDMDSDAGAGATGGDSLGAALTINNDNTGRHPIQPSAFGKAAIGKKKKVRTAPSNNDTAILFPTITKDNNRHNRTMTDIVTSTQHPITLRTAMSTQQVNKRRQLAIQALTQHLYLTRDATITILNRHPRLYTHLFNLNDRLSYLLNDLHLTRQTLKKMLLHHPRLMEKVFLDSEVNIASTMQVLEREIGLDRDDVIQMQLQKGGVTSVLSYPRSDLRKRILVLKNDLGYSGDEIRDMVRRDPRMLQTSSAKVRRLLQVLRQELGIGSGDVKDMMQKEILLLTYDAEKNIRPTIQYLKNGPVGRCLGMVERKGESTLLSHQTMEEKEALIRDRVKALVMGHPKVLSCSLERNLKPTVEFFWGSSRSVASKSVVGLTDYEFGKVLYRRGGSLLEANVERTLTKKVNFLRQELGLDAYDEECVDGDGDDVPLVEVEHGWNQQKVEIPLPRSLLVQEKDENDASGTIMSLSPYQSRRLLAQMIATTPDILTLSIETNLKPKIDYFVHTLKLEKDELRYVILKRPQLLSLSLDRNILPKIEFLLKERIPITSSWNGPDSYNGGLGMSMKEVRDWIVQHPQILTFGLEKRIRPRVFDIVRYNLRVGDGEGEAPLNCISRSEQSWKQWIQSNNVV